MCKRQRESGTVHPVRKPINRERVRLSPLSRRLPLPLGGSAPPFLTLFPLFLLAQLFHLRCRATSIYHKIEFPALQAARLAFAAAPFISSPSYRAASDIRKEFRKFAMDEISSTSDISRTAIERTFSKAPRQSRVEIFLISSPLLSFSSEIPAK